VNRSIGLKHWFLAAVLLLVAVLSVLPGIDNRAKDNYESLFHRAFVTFALARTLNGVISAVQGTELALQPAGVGVTLTPGEILDPVNDLVERFSWVMLGATISLGIQNVLMDVSAWWLVKLLVVILASCLLFIYFAGAGPGRKRRLVTRIFLIALFLRFAVPVTLIANDVLYQLFLESRYEESTQVVTVAGEEIREIGQVEEPAEQEMGDGGLFGSGMLESLGQAMDTTREALDLGNKVGRIKVRAAEMIEHLIQLAVVFILQTGILPLVFLWLFLQLAKWVFRPENL
jgi:hypothetical protein